MQIFLFLKHLIYSKFNADSEYGIKKMAYFAANLIDLFDMQILFNYIEL